MALTAALKAAHGAVDDAVASHAAAETLVNKLRNTIAQLPLATRSSDAQPATTAYISSQLLSR
jgi:DNA recombination-dependent growth factor C